MSYYLLHILNEGSSLKKERGHLICRYKHDTNPRRMALEDIRGVIVAARDVTFTDTLISALLERGAFILHCDSTYQPVGITASLTRLNKSSIAIKQARADEMLNRKLWYLLIKRKVHNQALMLDQINTDSQYLKQQIDKKSINESACARYYWRAYFDSLGYDYITRRGDSEHKVNMMLNYGYAVLGALCHRSLVAHGLSPLLGVHHKASFHGNPLVYDTIEPWRVFVDYLLHQHLSKNPAADIKEWAAAARQCWEMIIDIHHQNKQKLVDAIDYCVASLVNCYNENCTDKLWLPQLTSIG